MPEAPRIKVDGYECILCHELYAYVKGYDEDTDCPNCGGSGNYLATVEVTLGE